MNITIDSVCDIMTDVEAGSELDRLASVNDLTLMMSQQRCLDHTYKSMVTSLQQTGWDTEAAEGGRLGGDLGAGGGGEQGRGEGEPHADRH